MDVDVASGSEGRLGSEPTFEMSNAFKQWAMMRSPKPCYWDAKDWFRINHSVDDISEDFCNQLVNEALNEALETAAARAKVHTSPLFLDTRNTSCVLLQH